MPRTSGKIKPILTKTCKNDICKKIFTTKTKSQKYCSIKCAYDDQRGCERPSSEELVQLLTTMTQKQISQKFGVRQQTVSEWIKKDFKLLQSKS